jgi:hypothetical protein
MKIEIPFEDDEKIFRCLECLRAVGIKSVHLKAVTVRQWYDRVEYTGRMREVSRETKCGIEYCLKVSIRGELMNGRRFVCFVHNFFGWKHKYREMLIDSFDIFHWRESEDHQKKTRAKCDTYAERLLLGLQSQWPNAHVELIR